jgi:thiamine-phosphate pyrophosphorylase
VTAVRLTGTTLVCLVTPGPAFVPPSDHLSRRAALGALVRDAVRAQVDFVQVREPDLPARLLVEIVGEAVRASRGTATRILVNDRVDVALAAGADGVHLGTRSLPPHRVREIVPRTFLIGRSVHGVDEARDLASGGALDYMVAGTVFPSASKPELSRLLGPDGLSAIVESVGVPVLAIGGIALDNIPSIARAGASGFAAIRLFADAASSAGLDDLVAAARKAFDTARAIS